MLKCRPGSQQTIYWDGKTPGLGLRVTAAGSKAYIFESRVHGRTVRVTIGDPRTWGTKQAQTEATRLKSLTDKGEDPRAILKQQVKAADDARAADRAAETRNALLVATAWDTYIAHHTKRWGKRHLVDHRHLAQPGLQPKKRGNGLTVPGALYPLLRLRMVDVSESVLVSWQAAESAHRANKARQAFELFRAFWRWCASRPEYKTVIDASAVEGKEVRAGVPARKSKRFDVMERGQLAAWFGAVRTLDNPVMATYLQGLLLTGARREELAALKWEDVDFRWNSLWVKDKVAAEGRKIPLTPYFCSLIVALPRRNKWVFSSQSARDGRIVEPRVPHNRALAVAGLDHLTLHGLRRSFASLAEWVEMPTGVVAQIMGHTPSATAERHYKNRPLDLLAVWHNKYESWMLEQAGVPFASPADVQPLRMVNAA